MHGEEEIQDFRVAKRIVSDLARRVALIEVDVNDLKKPSLCAVHDFQVLMAGKLLVCRRCSHQIERP